MKVWIERQKFRLGHVEFLVMMGHPSRYARQTLGDVVSNGRDDFEGRGIC